MNGWKEEKYDLASIRDADWSGHTYVRIFEHETLPEVTLMVTCKGGRKLFGEVLVKNRGRRISHTTLEKIQAVANAMITLEE